MYSEEEVGALDDFFCIDYVSTGIKYIFQPGKFMKAATALRHLCYDINADPEEVMRLLRQLNEAMGTFLFLHAVKDEVWSGWCASHNVDAEPEDAYDDESVIPLWSGNKGRVVMRPTSDDPHGDIALYCIKHKQPTGK
jgi:hypothetical protein